MVVKLQNNAVVVVSKISKKAYDEATVYAPQAKVVKDDKGNAVFAVSGPSMKASLKPFGFEFNAVIDGNLAAVIQLQAGIKAEDAVEEVKLNAGAALAALAKHEGTLLAQLEDAVGPINAVMKDITVEE